MSKVLDCITYGDYRYTNFTRGLPTLTKVSTGESVLMHGGLGWSMPNIRVQANNEYAGDMEAACEEAFEHYQKYTVQDGAPSHA